MRMHRDLINTSLLVVVGRASGFLIPFVIAAAFGTTRQTDAFFLSYSLVLFITLVVTNLFETLVVPYVSNERAKGRKVGVLVGGIMAKSTAILSLATVFLLLLIKPLLTLTTDFQDESVALASRLVIEMAPMVLLVTWTSALNGALNAHKIFYVSALSPLFRSIIVILSVLVLAPRWGIHSVAWGFTAGEGIRFLVSLYFFQKRIGRLQLRGKSVSGVGQFFTSAIFQVHGYAFHCIIPVVNQFMASWLDSGDISIYMYAGRLRNLPFLLFSAGMASVIMSYWANQYSNSSDKFTWPHISRVILRIALLAALASLCCVLLRQLICSLALGWGAFPETRLPAVENLFAIFIISLPFDVGALLCIRLLVILRCDLFFMAATFCKLLLTVALNYSLIPRYGLMGIGIATVGANTLYAITLYGYVKKCCLSREEIRKQE
jgi:putative peptidoglycan lipid II flippase